MPPLEEAMAGEQTIERDGRTLLVTAAALDDEAGTVWTVRDATAACASSGSRASSWRPRRTSCAAR